MLAAWAGLSWTGLPLLLADLSDVSAVSQGVIWYVLPYRFGSWWAIDWDDWATASHCLAEKPGLVLMMVDAVFSTGREKPQIQPLFKYQFASCLVIVH